MENTANTTNDKFIVTGLFKDKDSAERACNALTERGYDKDEADVLMSDETRDRYYSGDAGDDTELGSKALEGTGAGAAIGGTLGAIIGGIAAIGTSVLLPGLGLIVAGPLAAALVGAGAGGLTGGLVGALIGSGIPEEHAAAYETAIKSGGIVLRANPRSAEDANYLEKAWKSCGGEQIYSNAAQPNTTAAASGATRQSGANADEDSVLLIEKEIRVSKLTVPTGDVQDESKIPDEALENRSKGLR